MKVERKTVKPVFEPITITLESLKEVKRMVTALTTKNDFLTRVLREMLITAVNSDA